ncbi:unnamed protein product, partial [Prorocentrum cordatum]
AKDESDCDSEATLKLAGPNDDSLHAAAIADPGLGNGQASDAAAGGAEGGGAATGGTEGGDAAVGDAEGGDAAAAGSAGGAAAAGSATRDAAAAGCAGDAAVDAGSAGGAAAAASIAGDAATPPTATPSAPMKGARPPKKARGKAKAADTAIQHAAKGKAKGKAMSAPKPPPRKATAKATAAAAPVPPRAKSASAAALAPPRTKSVKAAAPVTKAAVASAAAPAHKAAGKAMAGYADIGKWIQKVPVRPPQADSIAACSGTATPSKTGWGEDCSSPQRFAVGSFAALSGPQRRSRLSDQRELGLDALDDTFHCDRRGQPCDVMSSYAIRVTKKGQVFMCKLRSSRGVEVARCEERGAMKARLLRFTDHERKAFWSGLQECTKKFEVQTHLNFTLQTLAEKGQRHGKNGGYYPLTWHRKQGSPWRRIRSTCTDAVQHPVLGKCYRVEFHEIERWEQQVGRKVQEESAKGVGASGGDVAADGDRESSEGVDDVDNADFEECEEECEGGEEEEGGERDEVISDSLASPSGSGSDDDHDRSSEDGSSHEPPTPPIKAKHSRRDGTKKVSLKDELHSCDDIERTSTTRRDNKHRKDGDAKVSKHGGNTKLSSDAMIRAALKRPKNKAAHTDKGRSSKDKHNDKGTRSKATRLDKSSAGRAKDTSIHASSKGKAKGKAAEKKSADSTKENNHRDADAHEKAERESAKERMGTLKKAEKEKATKMPLATRAQAKLMVPHQRLEKAIESDGFGKLPDAIKKNATDKLQTLSAILRASSKIASRRWDPSKFTWTATEANDIANTADAQGVFVSTMCKSIQTMK